MWLVIWEDYEYTVECFETYEEALARYEEINNEHGAFIAKFHEGNCPF